MYEITIVDRMNNSHVIKAFEIEEICGDLKQINTNKFARLFPSTTASQIRRPKGKVQILVGNNYAPLHPSKKHICEGLVVYESIFGTGKILGGSHTQIRETNIINPIAHQCAHARISNVRVHQDLIINPGLDFITTEGFGVTVPKSCDNCKNCKVCKYEAHRLSMEEKRDLQTLRASLKLDPIEQVWTTPYPCKVDPSILKNNKEQALALVQKTEKRLLKDPPTATKYNEQFREFLNIGTFVEISKEEDEAWKGPVFHVNPHEVYKPDSPSTPVRIVVNSSLQFQGVSPNDVWIKGPNSLSDMFSILLKFRTHRYMH